MSYVVTHIVGKTRIGPSFLRRLSVQIRARMAGYKVFTIPNMTMMMTLREREMVSLDESAYRTQRVSRGDIVVYRSVKHDGLRLPSRVIGLSNEVVELRGGVLYIDGIEVHEPYVESGAADKSYSKDFGPLTVPEGSVFLMGDARDLSEDSRFLGAVGEHLIVGRIVSP